MEAVLLSFHGSPHVSIHSLTCLTSLVDKGKTKTPIVGSFWTLTFALSAPALQLSGRCIMESPFLKPRRIHENYLNSEIIS